MSTHRYPGGVISATPPTASASGAIGVWTLEEALRNKASGNWPDGGGADPYFQNTTLLLHGDGTNGAQNGTFLDSSANLTAVTRVGTPTQGTFTPYAGPGNWSIYYGPNQCGWQTPANSVSVILGSAFNSSATFTAEAWIYPLSRHSGGGAALGYVFGSMAIGGSSVDWSFGPDSNGNLVVFWYQGGNVTCKGSSVIPLNTWTHIAMSVSSGVIKLFVNGVSETLTGTTTITLSAPALTYVSSGGYLYAGTTWQGFNGYISNLRVVGKRALYSTSFTPSTTPLVATTDTTLLTNNQNGFADMSGCNWPLTLTSGNGFPISKFSPYTLYQISQPSYSGYFDGTGDYVSLPSANPALFNTNDFTIEAWVYPTARVTNSSYILAQSSYGVGSDFAFWITSAGLLQFYMLTGGGSNIVTSTGTIPLGAWTHVAIVRNGPVFKLYINGTNDGSLAGGQNITNTYVPATIANSSNNAGTVYFQGSISNMRVAKGIALYNSNFTPSTTALTSTTTSGGTTSYATSLNGSNSNLSVPATSAFAIPTSTTPFTVEAWIYPTAAGGAIFTDSFTSGDTIPISLHLSNGSIVDNTAGQVLTFAAYNGTTWTNCAMSNVNVTLNQWQHVAAVFTGSTCKLFINGVDVTKTSSPTPATTWPVVNSNGSLWYIGRRWDATATVYFSGLISNFRFTNGQALYTTAFTPATSPLTTTSQGATASNVVLLTCQDNLLIDNSLNRFYVSASGDAHSSTGGPFALAISNIGGTSYSGYFDGTGDYLSLSASTALALGSGDFTVEYWAYYNVITGSPIGFDTRSSGADIMPSDYVNTSGNLIFYYNSAALLTSTNVVTANRWNHIAWVRSGTTLTCYINGVSSGSVTTSAAFGTSQPMRIGGNITAANFINGYISNFRLVKGSAVYTGNFSPSTTPLTSVSGTSLLTCQNTTFIDNSGNSLAITANGNATTDTLNPFSGATYLLTTQSTTFVDNSAIPKTLTVSGNATPKRANPFSGTVTGPTQYGTSAYAGSLYLNSASNYLTLPAPSSLAIGTSNFTWEAWVYWTTAAAGYIYDNNASADGVGTGRFAVAINPDGTLRLITLVATNLLASAAGAISVNQWMHIAITRTGTTGYMFVNGVQVATATVSTNFLAATASATNRPVIGVNGNSVANPFDGYISNLRLITGTALYTSAFVPPATPVTAISGTQLLLNMSNAGILDNTVISDITAFGSAQISTSTVKYGTGSIYYPSSGSYLSFKGGAGTYNYSSIAGSSIFNAGNTFTIEAWMYPITKVSAAGYYSLILGDASTTSGTSLYWAVGLNSSGVPTVAWYDGVAKTAVGTTVISNNTWTHLAFVVTAGVVKIYVNGVSDTLTGTTTITTPSGSTGAINSGIDRANYWFGNLDDLRVTNGIARYSSNFTPIGPFPNY